MLVSLALVCSLAACQEPDSVTGPSRTPLALGSPTTVTLSADRDGYVTSKHPDRNGGDKDSMDVARPLRSLVGFDQAAIVAAVGSGALTSATLRLTIGRTAENWGPNGRTIDVHRVTVLWTEEGETWNCAIDSSPNNTTKECSGAAEWDMASTTAPPWALARTAQASVVNDMSGAVEFDVTADVAAFLNGTPNHGWLIKKTDEEKQGRIVFLTKEGGAAPELVLTVNTAVPDTARPSIPHTSGLPTSPANRISNPSNPEAVFYRDFVAIRFDSLASGLRINEILAEYQASIVGGVPRVAGVELYYVRIPDPGASWTDFQLLIQRLAQEPGVDKVGELQFGASPTLRGRYPIDGLTAPARDSWFRADASGGAQGTINTFNGIRAPLAWGCETGKYGSVPPVVGVFDYFFDGPTADLNVVARMLPTAADSLVVPQVAPSMSDREHGLGVASVAAAIGDNEFGTTGVAWGAPLLLVAFATNDLVSGDPFERFFAALNAADSADVQILNLSFTFGGMRADTSLAVSELARGMRWFLAGSPKRIIVLALPEIRGAIGATSSLSAVASGQAPRLEALDMAAAQVALLPAYTDRIIFVAGTSALSGLKWAPSDVWTGGRVIAAPADGILTLASSPSGISWEGNSFAAPLVGGVAALLWAMDSSLNGSEVTDLLLGGAQAPREDPTTGTFIARPDIGVAAVHQLDAYGSLKLLSYERPGTPLCGLTITNTGNQWYQTQSVVHRKGGTELVAVGGQPVAFTSIAQGGRLAAAGTEKYRLSGGNWVGAGSGGDEAVVFLEQDTAYLRPVTTTGTRWSRTDLRLRIASSDTSRIVAATNVTEDFQVNLVGALYYHQSADYTPQLVSISPTGDWVYVEFTGGFNDDCNARPSDFWEYRGLISLRGGQDEVLSTRHEAVLSCETIPLPISITSTAAAGGRIAWSGDGREFYYGREYYDADTRLERWTVAEGVNQLGPGLAVGVLAFDALIWSQEGGRLLSREQYLSYDPPGDCRERIRASASPATMSKDVKVGDYYTSCFDIPLMAARLTPAAGLRTAPAATPRSSINRRYPLGIPRSLRAN